MRRIFVRLSLPLPCVSSRVSPAVKLRKCLTNEVVSLECGFNMRLDRPIFPQRVPRLVKSLSNMLN